MKSNLAILLAAVILSRGACLFVFNGSKVSEAPGESVSRWILSCFAKVVDFFVSVSRPNPLQGMKSQHEDAKPSDNCGRGELISRCASAACTKVFATR
jgi:hypothetical protein